VEGLPWATVGVGDSDDKETVLSGVG
jgi:hypothetical protein